jgi:Flp pilus assembly protein TadG
VGCEIKVKRNKEKGQTLVEFALVIPLLLLLVFGIIEFGRVYHAQLVVTSAAREGARKATVDDDSTYKVRDAIQNAASTLNVTVSEKTYSDYLANEPIPSQMFYCIRYPDGSRNNGDPVEVYVKTKISIFVPIISAIVGTEIVLPAMATMRVEKI